MRFQFVRRKRLVFAVVLLLLGLLRMGLGQMETWQIGDQTLPTFFPKSKWSWQFSFEHSDTFDQPGRFLSNIQVRSEWRSLKGFEPLRN